MVIGRYKNSLLNRGAFVTIEGIEKRRLWDPSALVELRRDKLQNRALVLRHPFWDVSVRKWGVCW